MNFKSIFLLGFGLSLAQAGLAVQEPEVKLEFIQTSHRSSFPPLMRVAINNAAYTPLNLVDRAKSSELVIDGKPFWRKEVPFEGPPGLPAMGHWEACVPIEDYTVSIPPGRHHVFLRMGSAQSNEVTVDWSLPLNWRKGNLKTRMKEVRDMADALTKGLPRSCVEDWLTVKDGGDQDSSPVRYFLEPFIKVLVPYAHEGGSGLDAEVVDGPAQVYQENSFRE